MQPGFLRCHGDPFTSVDALEKEQCRLVVSTFYTKTFCHNIRFWQSFLTGEIYLELVSFVLQRESSGQLCRDYSKQMNINGLSE